MRISREVSGQTCGKCLKQVRIYEVALASGTTNEQDFPGQRRTSPGEGGSDG